MIPVGEQEACRKIRQHLQFNHEIDAAYVSMQLIKLMA
jgi:hypothetical protein